MTRYSVLLGTGERQQPSGRNMLRQLDTKPGEGQIGVAPFPWIPWQTRTGDASATPRRVRRCDTNEQTKDRNVDITKHR